jgi:1-acyl-sn-glycerol-3-phosphate acyltransferase
VADSSPNPPLGPGGVIYGIYAWLAFIVCALFALLFTLIVPGLDRRRRWVTACARAPFPLAGIRVDVNGLERIPQGSSVVVANHASYLDGVLLQAYLPPRFSYVIKGEMRTAPVIGFLLRRIGSKFVERFDTSGSARDARSLLKAARDGESLAFFPEGTFIAEPGLGRFRRGAFAAAISAGVPLVPVVISGSRRILRGETILPRHGHLAVDILEPIRPDEPEFSDHQSLVQAARQRILDVLDEPDLLADRAKRASNSN